MNAIIIGVWCANLLLSLLYGLLALRKGSKPWLALFFIGLPVLGFLIYAAAVLVMKLSKKHTYDRDSLVQRNRIDQIQAAPHVQKELDLIPVEDAMAVGSNKEKRFLLLDQLKKDILNNYKSILPASADTDSESAHYVAAGMMEMYRRKRADLKQLQDAARETPDNPEAVHAYLSGLIAYMNSELISPKEALIYETEYCRQFEALHTLDEAGITKPENTAYVTYLIDLKKTQQADAYWNSCPDIMKDEEGYRQMLELYYDQTDRKRFYTCLEMLRKSDIVLSAEGLKMLRFWEARGN